MTEEQLITTETLNLAISKGFNPRSDVEIVYGLNAKLPTQSKLQTWLRNKHNIHTFIGRRPNVKKWDVHAYNLEMTAKEYVEVRTLAKFKEQELFNTYEEALEKGLQEGLKQIKTNN